MTRGSAGRFIAAARRLPVDRPHTAIAVVVFAWHLGVVGLYVGGRAVSPLPYKSDTVRQFIGSPLVPVTHAAAAALLVAAFASCRLRQHVAVYSVAVCAGTAAVLGASAQNHDPRGVLWGALAAALLTFVSTILVAGWGVDDDEGT